MDDVEKYLNQLKNGGIIEKRGRSRNLRDNEDLVV